MLRVISGLTNSLVVGSKWLATCQMRLPWGGFPTKTLPLYSANYRRMATKDETDSEDELIVPEGRKGREGKSQGPMLRTYLDPLKFVPLTEHLLVFDTVHRIPLRKNEYDVLLLLLLLVFGGTKLILELGID